jgi:uncharacterized OB-fold protein
MDWKEVPGTGEVYTYTNTHYAAGEAHEGHTPYNVSVIMLDGTEDIRLVSQVLETEPGNIEIGMPVEVVWEQIDDEITIPLFEPVS